MACESKASAEVVKVGDVCGEVPVRSRSDVEVGG